MKKIILLFCTCSIIVLACHKNTMPTVTTRTDFPPAPKTPHLPENSPEAIAAGKTLFETRCNRCHDLKDPKGYSSERWTPILQSMIPKARLNEEQAKEVSSYVMTNSKK
jgi:mono/diheme cytochrome c family protein